jgi:dTDP-4-dehydrorhamnose reductase
MRILITGGDGFIGSSLIKDLILNNKLEVFGVDLEQSCWNSNLPIEKVDIRDNETITSLLNTLMPDVVILNGAIKGLDNCEKNLAALNTNVFSHKPFMEYALSNENVHTIYISTDMVFSGCLNPPFTENDYTLADNAYGIMKVASEQLMKLLPKYSIVRTALVYGPMSSQEKLKHRENLQADELMNQSHLIHWAIERSNCDYEVRLANNIYSSPTFIADLVYGIRQIIERKATGIFHCAGTDHISRYEMGKIAAEYGGKPRKVIPYSASCDNIRPLNVTLSSTLTQSKLNLNVTSISDGIKRSVGDR